MGCTVQQLLVLERQRILKKIGNEFFSYPNRPPHYSETVANYSTTGTKKERNRAHGTSLAVYFSCPA